ncbi:MAG: hypothetical protein COB49_07030 [Alphaproteobacteria bacterium]|nr:MAG: hypothetical protein COB49_07030 [Alphaproteobacteria bacterium]
MMNRRKITSYIIFFLINIFMLTPVHAISPDVVRAVQSKAALAMEKLRQNMEAGKDVSRIIPMMKQVKVLGDQGKLDQANRLLDRILHEFKAVGLPAISHKPPLFINPRKVNIKGYKQSVMEAFITRDGKYLFFNNDTNDTPKTDKDIYYAVRIDDVNFKYMGEIKGINSAAVDGVPTMDKNGNFYFISMVNYTKHNSFATVYSGKFKDGHVRNIRPHPEVSLNLPGWINMDIEISADGNTLYSTQTYFGDGPPPKQSYFFVAHLKSGKFEIDSRSNEIFHNINTSDLEYGASVSADGRELYFTRLSFANGGKFTSFYATRPDRAAAFSVPSPISAITGIAEAPAITSDGKLLYFHKKDHGRFFLYVLERAKN